MPALSKGNFYIMLLLKINYFLVVLLFLSTTFANGQENQQSNDLVATAYAYVHHHLDDWGLEEEDIQEMTIQDMYTDKSSGITRIYFLQKYQQIPVYNAIINLNMNKEGMVYYAGCRFVKQLQEKIATHSPVLSAQQAIDQLVNHLGLQNQPVLLQQQMGDAYVFEGGSLCREAIPVSLMYLEVGDDVRGGTTRHQHLAQVINVFGRLHEA